MNIKKILKILWISLFFFFILLISNPNTSYQNAINSVKWIDIHIVFDISYSMLAKDFFPNRIESSKEILKNFVSTLKNDRIWLILYSWKPFLQSPLTLDYNIFYSLIDNISVESIKQYDTELAWTATWDALLLASNYFDNASKREKIIILITDWDNKKWADLSEVSPYLASENIKVYWIWVWKESNIMVDEIWFEVEWVKSSTLKEIVEVTWWAYFRATENSALEEVFQIISNLEKKEIILENNVVYTPFYNPFQFIVFIILFLILLIYKKKYV